MSPVEFEPTIPASKRSQTHALDCAATEIGQINAVELCYNVIKLTECILSLRTSVVLTEEYNVMVNSEELIGTTKYLTL